MLSNVIMSCHFVLSVTLCGPSRQAPGELGILVAMEDWDAHFMGPVATRRTSRLGPRTGGNHRLFKDVFEWKPVEKFEELTSDELVKPKFT